ncbi:MAG: aminoacyl-tRNA deacylase [Chloroflexi bacterium]|nr:MAG: aminoacyl-tRNA deacylase [Chloroflexota bacterium]
MTSSRSASVYLSGSWSINFSIGISTTADFIPLILLRRLDWKVKLIIISGLQTMPITNNVTRFLDSRKVKYAAHELPAEKLGARDVALYLNVPENQVFKTIVTKREKGKPVLALVPAPCVVDLKLLADFLGEKKMHLPTEREAEQMTGLQAGGISPLALINKGFQVVIDLSAQEFDEIYISGGQRGLNIQLGVKDLAKLVNARFAEVSKIL